MVLRMRSAAVGFRRLLSRPLVASLSSTPPLCMFRTGPRCQRLRWLSSSSSSSPSRRTITDLECWKCDHILRCPVAFCPGCKVVQPPAETEQQSPFEAFGLEPKFDIDLDLLADRYKSIQKKTHPDLFETKSSDERKFALRQSTLMNQFYEALRDPVNRAIELLRLKGVQWSDSETLEDQELLWELLDLREQAEESVDPEVLAHVRGVVVDGLVEDHARFSDALNKDELTTAKDSLCRMMYRSRLLGYVCTKQPVV